MLGEWVIVTPNRATRPFQDEKRPCPFCPGQPETKGDWEVLTLKNRYAALQPDDHPVRLDSELVIGTSAHGYCKVIIESREHDRQIEMMDRAQLEKVFREYIRVFNDLEAKEG